MNEVQTVFRIAEVNSVTLDVVIISFQSLTAREGHKNNYDNGRNLPFAGSAIVVGVGREIIVSIGPYFRRIHHFRSRYDEQ